MRIPKKVANRLTKQVGIFQKVLSEARHRDINESNTVTIVTDMLADVFGFDKYSEVTSEQAIRGTYCDLAVQIDGETQYLVEVKAIGIDLKDSHLRQAINYGANHGVPWVILTNGVEWQVHRILFEQPVTSERVTEFDFFELSMRRQADKERLFLLCKSGMSKNAISDFHSRQKVVNRYVIAVLIQSDQIVSTLRRNLRRIAPESKATIEEIEELLPNVLKRDVLEGDAVTVAKRLVTARLNKVSKPKKRKPKETTPDQ